MTARGEKDQARLAAARFVARTTRLLGERAGWDPRIRIYLPATSGVIRSVLVSPEGAVTLPESLPSASGKEVSGVGVELSVWVRRRFPVLRALQASQWTGGPSHVAAAIAQLEASIALAADLGLSNQEAQQNLEVLRKDLDLASDAIAFIEGQGFQLARDGSTWRERPDGRGRPRLLRSILVAELGSILKPLAPRRRPGKPEDHGPLTLAVSRTLGPYLSAKDTDPGSREVLRSQVSEI